MGAFVIFIFKFHLGQLGLNFSCSGFLVDVHIFKIDTRSNCFWFVTWKLHSGYIPTFIQTWHICHPYIIVGLILIWLKNKNGSFMLDVHISKCYQKIKWFWSIYYFDVVIHFPILWYSLVGLKN